jgi:hypothetical protein
MIAFVGPSSSTVSGTYTVDDREPRTVLDIKLDFKLGTVLDREIYNFSFKSCRAAPRHLRKASETMVDLPGVNLYYCIVVLNWSIPKSVCYALHLYIVTRLCSTC